MFVPIYKANTGSQITLGEKKKTKKQKDTEDLDVHSRWMLETDKFTNEPKTIVHSRFEAQMSIMLIEQGDKSDIRIQERLYPTILTRLTKSIGTGFVFMHIVCQEIYIWNVLLLIILEYDMESVNEVNANVLEHQTKVQSCLLSSNSRIIKNA